MDSYTRTTKAWLDERFKTFDDSGIYFAHQPIYGFHNDHCEPGTIEKYIRTYQIMRALLALRVSSLLDVGGAEGYKAHIAAKLFGIDARTCDLSEEACRRAREIFGIDSVAADMHDLPFGDNSFDVVLCSESLEHVTDLRKATLELVRVASKAVVITVPQESEQTVNHTINSSVPHGHIHSLNLTSFDFLKRNGYDVKARKAVSPYLRFIFKMLPVHRQEYSHSYPKIVFDIYNGFTPILKRIVGERMAALLVRVDDVACNLANRFDAMVFTILKRAQPFATRSAGFSATRIIRYKVPYYRKIG